MVAAHPTRRSDLRRVQTHRFVPDKCKSTATCSRCWLKIDNDVILLWLPECPGASYILMDRNNPTATLLVESSEGKHKRE